MKLSFQEIGPKIAAAKDLVVERFTSDPDQDPTPVEKLASAAVSVGKIALSIIDTTRNMAENKLGFRDYR